MGLPLVPYLLREIVNTTGILMASRPRRGNGSQRFKTDDDISASAAGSHKPLQRWVDDDSTDSAGPALSDLSLEAAASKQPWDQFAANREKFGIVPSYDEHKYTTKVNTSHPDFASREQRAIKLAKEIEGQSHDGNAHLAEERGLGLKDQNVDEEDLYSGVTREEKDKSNTQEKRQQFAAKEAQRAMLSPSYLQSRERSDESEDLKRFSEEFKVKGEVPEDLLPILGKKPRATNQPEPSKSTASTSTASSGNTAESSGASSETGGTRKKKFDFSASVAKGSSFKSSFSPPPRGQSFTPNRSSGSASPAGARAPAPVPVFPPGAIPGPGGMPPPNVGMIPPGIPGMIPMVPMMQPNFYGGAPGIPPMMPPPTQNSKSVSPAGSDLSADQKEPAKKEIKPLGTDFDYIATLKSKEEKTPPIFATLPTWATNSTESYMDQLPAVTFTPQPFVPWM